MPRANIVARSTVKPGRLAEAVELGSRVADLLVESGAQSSRFWVPVFNQDINQVAISSVCDSIASLDEVGSASALGGTWFFQHMCICQTDASHLQLAVLTIDSHHM